VHQRALLDPRWGGIYIATCNDTPMLLKARRGARGELRLGTSLPWTWCKELEFGSGGDATDVVCRPWAPDA
jgi:hypothetical protein